MAGIYKILCAACGSDIGLKDLDLNADLDLMATVDPCEHCCVERFDAGEHNGHTKAQDAANARIAELLDQIADLENQLASKARG